MKKIVFLESITTRFFFLTVFLLIIFLFGTYFLLARNSDYNITEINNIVDTILKSLVIIIGMIWFLNRYFTERKDALKFDIEVDYTPIKLLSGQTLLIYRLDLFNRGNSLFKDYSSSFSIDGFKIIDNQIIRENIDKYPQEGYYKGHDIEPNSWAAINHELLIDKEYEAIRFYYEIVKDGKKLWTWHKTYKV